jgi:hypothetical protein
MVNTRPPQSPQSPARPHPLHFRLNSDCAIIPSHLASAIHTHHYLLNSLRPTFAHIDYSRLVVSPAFAHLVISPAFA